MSLPNPQMMADAQALIVFAQAVSQAVVKLVHAADASTPEYQEIKPYLIENMPKLETLTGRLVETVAARLAADLV